MHGTGIIGWHGIDAVQQVKHVYVREDMVVDEINGKETAPPSGSGTGTPKGRRR